VRHVPVRRDGQTDAAAELEPVRALIQIDQHRERVVRGRCHLYAFGEADFQKAAAARTGSLGHAGAGRERATAS
jgi:hypothetical protein